MDSKYVSNSLILLISQGLAIVAGICSQVLLTRNLEINDYGMLILLIDLGLTIGVVVDFGIPTYASVSWNGERNTLRPLIEMAHQKQLVVATILAISLVMYSFTFESFSYFGLLAVISGFLIMLSEPFRLGLRLNDSTIHEGVSRSLERVVILIGYCFMAVFFELTLNTAALTIFSCSIVTLIHAKTSFRIGLPQDFGGKTVEVGLLEIMKLSLPYALVTVSYPLIGRVDKILLAVVESTTSAGIYNIGWLVIGIGFVVTNKLRQAATPAFAKARDTETRMGIVTETTQFNSLILFTGVIACSFMAVFAVPALFSGEYSSNESMLSGTALIIAMLPSWVWSVFSSTKAEALKFELSSWGYSVYSNAPILVNAAVSYICIIEYGIIGAIIGSTASQVFFWLSSIAIMSLRLHQSDGYPVELLAGVLLSAGLFELSGLGFGLGANPNIGYACLAAGMAIIAYLASRGRVMAVER